MPTPAFVGLIIIVLLTIVGVYLFRRNASFEGTIISNSPSFNDQETASVTGTPYTHNVLIIRDSSGKQHSWQIITEQSANYKIGDFVSKAKGKTKLEVVSRPTPTFSKDNEPTHV